MKAKTGTKLPRRIIGATLLAFCLFWWLFSIMGIFSFEYMLPVGLFGVILCMYGFLSIIGKIGMVLNFPDNTGAGAATIIWIILLLIVGQTFPIFVPIITAFPLWYIIGTFVFFIVSPLVDLVETLRYLAKK